MINLSDCNMFFAVLYYWYWVIVTNYNSCVIRSTFLLLVWALFTIIECGLWPWTKQKSLGINKIRLMINQSCYDSLPQVAMFLAIHCHFHRCQKGSQDFPWWYSTEFYTVIRMCIRIDILLQSDFPMLVSKALKISVSCASANNFHHLASGAPGCKQAGILRMVCRNCQIGSI